MTGDQIIMLGLFVFGNFVGMFAGLYLADRKCKKKNDL